MGRPALNREVVVLPVALDMLQMEQPGAVGELVEHPHWQRLFLRVQFRRQDLGRISVRRCHLLNLTATSFLCPEQSQPEVASVADRNRSADGFAEAKP